MGKEHEESHEIVKNILSEENKVSHVKVCAAAAESLFSPAELGYKCDFKMFPKTLKQAIIPAVRQCADGFKDGGL